jgi:predicted transcriptional regulator of viral defense system
MITKRTLKALKGRLFSRKDMAKLGLTGNHIQELLGSGQIWRLSRGVYSLPSQDMNEGSQFQGAILRIKGRSAICLLSALSIYNLTDLIPKKVWLLVDKQKRTIHSDLRLFRTRNPHWKTGIVQNRGYAITSIERTLVECLVHRRLLGTNTAIAAIKTAIARKETTLSKLVDMAVKLEVYHRILPYIESLA